MRKISWQIIWLNPINRTKYKVNCYEHLFVIIRDTLAGNINSGIIGEICTEVNAEIRNRTIFI
jgi:hypothetical protein